MKDLLELIVKNIATHPDEVVITEAAEGAMVTYTITVNPEDMGRIIGKSGKVIKSIRNIAHVAAIRQGTRYRINVAEVGGSSTDVEAPITDGEEDNVVYNNEAEAPAGETSEDLISEAMEIPEAETEADKA